MRADTAASNALVATKSSRRFAKLTASSHVPPVRNARNFWRHSGSTGSHSKTGGVLTIADSELIHLYAAGDDRSMGVTYRV
jgi:hypothetical protein